MNGVGYRALRFAVRALFRALFHLRVVGDDRPLRTGAAVLVANHESWLDPIVLPLVLPRKPAFLAMKELWQGAVTALAMRLYGPLAIPVDRTTVDATALKRALRTLASGAILIVFPEGGISPDGRLRPFHRGAAMLAARAGAPMIPVAIQGTAQALPLGQVVPRRRPITVRFGTPVVPAGQRREDLERASEAAAAQIRELRRQPTSEVSEAPPPRRPAG